MRGIGMNKNKKSIYRKFASIQSKVQKFNQDVRNGKALDFHIVVEYTVEFAEMNRFLSDYYSNHRYSNTLLNSNTSEESIAYISCFITNYDKRSHSCWNDIMEMWSLHGINEDNDFNQVEEVKKFFKLLNDLAFYGKYSVPNNPDLLEFKRKILCKSIDLAFLVWMNKKNSISMIEGHEKLIELREDYRDYRICMGNSVTILNYDGCNGVWNGPEFGLEMERILESAEKYYENQPIVYQNSI